MKKLLIINIIIALINVVIGIYLVHNFHGTRIVFPDTVINRVRIDSIQTIIDCKDSEVINIKEKIEYEKSVNDCLNGTDVVLLFERLVNEE